MDRSNIHTLVTWIHVAEYFAAICTTSVPVLYSFLPWRRTMIGKLFMLQALAFAAAVDLTAIFALWAPTNILVVFWSYVIVLTCVGIATGLLTVIVLSAIYRHWKGKRDEIRQ